MKAIDILRENETAANWQEHRGGVFTFAAPFGGYFVAIGKADARELADRSASGIPLVLDPGTVYSTAPDREAAVRYFRRGETRKV